MLTTDSESLRVSDDISLPPTLPKVVNGRAQRVDTYPIHVVPHISDAVEVLLSILAGRSAVVLTDTTVAELHAQAFLDPLRSETRTVETHIVPAGEKSKSLDHATALLEHLVRSDLARRDCLIALGGGVITDLGGWVASAYMRGIPYINIPTTLLAQVDGAIGGKVAVNHAVAKNLIGAFYQPHAVISCSALLDTLPARHIRAGLAESIKKAIIASPDYFHFIASHLSALLDRSPESLQSLVAYASFIKTALVERDPYELDLRRALNFGHTVGHPVETVTGYGPILHGEAIAFGMAVEANIALARGLLEPSTLVQILSVLRAAQLPVALADFAVPVVPDAVIQALDKVRQIRAGNLRCVLPLKLGDTLIADDVTTEEIATALLATCPLA